MPATAPAGASHEDIKSALSALGGPTKVARDLHLSINNAKKWSSGATFPNAAEWGRIKRAAKKVGWTDGGAGEADTQDTGAGDTGDTGRGAIIADLKRRIAQRRMEKFEGIGPDIRREHESAVTSDWRVDEDYRRPVSEVERATRTRRGDYGADGDVYGEPGGSDRPGRDNGSRDDSPDAINDEYQGYADLRAEDEPTYHNGSNGNGRGSVGQLPRGALFDDEYSYDAPAASAAIPGRPKPSGAKGFTDYFATLLAQGKLGVGEARDLRPDLIEAITNGTDSLDDLMTRTNRMHTESQIWSSMDDADIALLADTLLSLGKRSSVAAGAVRATAQGYMTIRALMIIVPRLLDTARFYPANGGFGL